MSKLNRALAALGVVSLFLIGCGGGSSDPSPDGATGSLFVDSAPQGASVFVDDVAEGFTPVTIREIDVGDHILRVESEGRVPFVEDVTIVAGDNTPVMADLVPMVAETGFLAITTDPPELDGVPVVAQVVMNGSPTNAMTNGMTPGLVEVDTSIGHDVAVSLDGFHAVEQPDARCDPGSRVAVVVPIGADVDGRFRASRDGRIVEVETIVYRGQIILNLDFVSLTVSGYDLTVESDGYSGDGRIVSDLDNFEVEVCVDGGGCVSETYTRL